MTVLVLNQKKTQVHHEPITTQGKGFGAKTILFNDNVHTFDEVAHQLTRAIHCAYSKAMELANQVHKTGSAIVYTGHLERCEAVAMILEEIKLRVKVER